MLRPRLPLNHLVSASSQPLSPEHEDTYKKDPKRHHRRYTQWNLCKPDCRFSSSQDYAKTCIRDFFEDRTVQYKTLWCKTRAYIHSHGAMAHSSLPSLRLLFFEEIQHSELRNLPSCYLTPYSLVDTNSTVGTATRYGLDDPGIEARWGRDFPHPSILTLWPTQPPIRWVPGLFSVGKRVGAWR